MPRLGSSVTYVNAQGSEQTGTMWSQGPLRGTWWVTRRGGYALVANRTVGGWRKWYQVNEGDGSTLHPVVKP